MRMAFFFDQTRCMSCSSCTVACKDYYDVNPGPVSYRRQDIFEQGDKAGKFYPFSMACNHCEDPACQKNCGAGAISKRADGIVVVDRSKCLELRSCIDACPFNEPGIADDRQEPNAQDTWGTDHPMQKCNMCVELLDQGQAPVCVRACPMRVLEVGDYDELMRKHPGAVQISATDFPYAYVNNTTDTKPSFIVKPRGELLISGDL